ncbi:MAG: amidoligase family protein [Polyangiales bacterium]
MRFRAPPSTSTDLGRERRVGIEVEFAGVSVDDAIEIVTRLYGGRVVPKNRFESVIEGTTLGDFRVEIDSKVVTDRKITGVFGKLFGEGAQDTLDTAIESIAGLWIPSEIVSPPTPLSRLAELEKLRLALAAHHARGTRASVLYGFAFQLNPEVPSTDATSLRHHLQSFLVLYDWLVEMSEVDLTRRIGPFITAFPEDYQNYVLDDRYSPALEELIADYLIASPTRNRPLDMLPVFAALRPEQVRAAVGSRMKINPRPAFHYRLPNSQVDEPAWSFALEWNRWCEVERLAADPLRLRQLARTLRRRRPRSEPERLAWLAEVERTLA